MPSRHARPDRAAEAAAARERLRAVTGPPPPWVPRVPAVDDVAAEQAIEELPVPPSPSASRRPAPDAVPPLTPAWRAGLLDRLPPRARALGLRVGLRPGHVVVLVVVATAALVGALLLLRAAQPQVQPVPARADLLAPTAVGSTPSVATSAPPTASAPTPSASPAPTPTEVVVDVAGRVRHPGVRRLPAGSRVVDAVRASGGAVPGTDLTGLNLARPLVDGEQVAVGVPPAEAAPAGQVPAATGAAGPTSGAVPSGGPVDLNAATLEQLDALPGVGPVLGQRILDWRAQHGRFSSVEELGEVSGIGEARMADLRARVVV